MPALVVEQASCLLLSLKQARCLLSQCLERLKPVGLSSELKRIQTDGQIEAPNKVSRMKEAPFIYAFLKPQKPFSPSADPSFLLILSIKQAEGFGFQTLQTLQPTLQADFS